VIPGALLSLVEGWVGPKFAKPLIYGTAALLLAILIFAAVKIHDHRVIAAHDAGQSAVVANAVIGADRYATQQKDTRDQTFANSQTAIGNAVGNAVAANPAKVKQPVGPASQSYYDELRKQQRGGK
jgi:hypothetical protein